MLPGTIVCLLLDTLHRTNHFIKFCGKWIFDSNFEVTFPITQDCLNYTCRGNYTDEIKFVGVLHAIRAVPPTHFQGILNIKQELLIIILIGIITI